MKTQIFARIALMVSLSTLFAVTGFAQEKKSLSVEEAIAIGLQNSKSLHSSGMRVSYADARMAEVGASRLPSLKFGGSYTRLSDLPPFQISLPAALAPPGSDGKFTLAPVVLDNYSTRFTLQQPLFTGFRLDASYDAADYTVQAAQADYTNDRSELTYNIKNAFWTLYKAIEFKKMIDENVEQIKAHVGDVQKMMDQGMATNNDVLKVQVQLSDAQLRQIDARNSVRLAMIGLNNTIGIPLNTEIEETSVIDVAPKSYPPLEDLLKKAFDARPDVKAMEFRVKAAQSGVTAAKGGWWPQIFLVGNYYYAKPNQRLQPVQNIYKDTWDIGVSVSFDIWNWGTTVHQTDQASSQLAQVQDAYGQMKDGVTLDLTQAYLNVGQAKERIEVAKQGVAQAEENYRITHTRFTEGLALNSDLLDAEVALLQAKTNFTQSQVDYELSVARLNKSLGE